MGKKALLFYCNGAVASIATVPGTTLRRILCCCHGSRTRASRGARTDARLRVGQHDARSGDGRLPMCTILGIATAGEGEALRGKSERAQPPVRLLHVDFDRELIARARRAARGGCEMRLKRAQDE